MTGGDGALARALVDAAAKGPHELVALGRARLDVTDPAGVRRVLGEVRPDVVVHAAALSDVDACERDPGRAEAVNATAAGDVAAAAAALGARTVLVSTDLVFGGAVPRGVAGGAPRGWLPDDEPAPVQAYGRSKAAAERLVAAASDDHLVVRTAVLAGPHDHGFVGRVAARARAGRDLRVVDDQVASPTFTDDLAPALLELATGSRRGVVHRTGAGHASRHALAVATVELLGLDVPVEAIPSDALPVGAAPRPGWSVLADPDGALPPWRTSLAAFVAATGDALGAGAAP